jgi:hypothetical protein
MITSALYTRTETERWREEHTFSHPAVIGADMTIDMTIGLALAMTATID